MWPPFPSSLSILPDIRVSASHNLWGKTGKFLSLEDDLVPEMVEGPSSQSDGPCLLLPGLCH